MISIMNTVVKNIPLKAQEIAFDKEGKKEIYSDPKGKRVNKIQLQAAQYKWVYEDGNEYTGKSYKNIGGKPIKSFPKTTEVKNTEIISKEEIKYFLMNELTYLIIGVDFKEKMIKLDKENKAITFNYVNSGFKVHKAIMVYDKELDRVFMRCYRGDIRKMELPEETEAKELISDDGVEGLDIDSLEA